MESEVAMTVVLVINLIVDLVVAAETLVEAPQTLEAPQALEAPEHEQPVSFLQSGMPIYLTCSCP